MRAFKILIDEWRWNDEWKPKFKGIANTVLSGGSALSKERGRGDA